MAAPKVSIIIPTYNCCAYISESITSSLKQSYRNIELIIVDDGSTDNTKEIIKKYLDDPRIKYIRKSKRAGLPAARNTGIDIALGELIAFLDADDIFLEHKILNQIKAFEENKKCDICYTNEIYFKDGVNKEVLSNRYHFSGDIFYYLKRSNFIHISTVMAKSALLKKNRFDETLHSHEDWELFLRLAFMGINFFYIKIPLSKIRIREHCMTLNKDIMNSSRKKVGVKGRAYWNDLKRHMKSISWKGQQATLRYLKLKAKAFLIGFPKKACFNRPAPYQLLCSDYTSNNDKKVLR